MDYREITNIIFEAAVAKRLRRTGWQILGDNDEGVGEHIFMTCVIAYFLTQMINKDKASGKKADLEKVLTMSLFHDFHEARTGEVDKIATFYITRDQNKANNDIFKSVDIKLYSLLKVYEQKKTLEARIVYEANIIALLVELKILEEKGNIHAGEWIRANKARCHLPQSRKLIEILIKTSSQNWWRDIRKRLVRDFKKE